MSCRYLYEGPGTGDMTGQAGGDTGSGLWPVTSLSSARGTRMMIDQLWAAEENRISLFGQKVGKTTPQPTTQPQPVLNCQQSWIWGEGVTGRVWTLVIHQMSPAQRCSSLGIVINYRRNVSSQPKSLVRSKLSDWWVNLAILITYQSWNISSQQQQQRYLASIRQDIDTEPSCRGDNYVERNHRIRGHYLTIKSSSDIIFPSSSQSLCHASVRLALITSSPSRPISRGCQIIMYQLISPRPAPAVTPNVWLARPLSQCHTGRRADISGPCVNWKLETAGWERTGTWQTKKRNITSFTRERAFACGKQLIATVRD